MQLRSTASAADDTARRAARAGGRGGRRRRRRAAASAADGRASVRPQLQAPANAPRRGYLRTSRRARASSSGTGTPGYASPSTNSVGVRGHPGADAGAEVALHPLGHRVGAAVGLEALEVEAEPLARAPTGAGRRGGPGRRRASRASPRSGPAARRPRLRGPAPAPAGAWRPPGSGGTPAARQRPPAGASAFAQKGHSRSAYSITSGALAPHVVIRAGRRDPGAARPSGRLAAGPARRR